ncbi:PhoX family protein [Pseudokineococcus sp. 1T1Z-3]|uniref:PhoX family protein n=1 Tax=Pseudokineococcus sp. 1T1Z-3 TaxID=3132745 RepID=UPI0030AAE58C
MTTTSCCATDAQPDRDERAAPARGPRQALPMTGHTLGSRSAQTCHFRCADACLSPMPSTSTAPRFADLAERAIGRRALLGGLGAAVVVGAALAPRDAQAAGRSRAVTAASAPGAFAPAGAMAGFAPVGPIAADVDDLVVPQGWEWHSIIAWGDAVERDAPAFDLDAQTPEAQAKQFGYNCDFLTVVPLGRGGNRALLVANHEYTNENIMYPGYTDDASLTVEQRMTSMAAHGMSVVEVRRDGVGAPWRVVPGRYGRRLTASGTPFRLTGPVAGSDLVKTSEDPTGTAVIGTLNNCAGGTTPWGTVLSGEENFQGYFKNSDRLDARNGVYGISNTGRGWELGQARFDTASEPNEVNRFGWIVELNPYDPFSTPRKHTAMGRFRHEGADASIAPDGRVVCYMGDDQADQHLYKFVSRDRVGQRPRQGREYDVLEHGDLYTARFAVEGDPSSTYDGTGEWVPLTRGGRSAVPGMSLEEVLTFTRTAAAAVGATPMDRPEDVERNPVTGRVYMACTNSSRRPAPGAANPRALNRYGHVVELTEDGDQTATTFTWSLPVVCGDPDDPSTYFSGLPASEVMPIACPDNVAFDSYGGLWVSTDGQPGSLQLNDALHHVTTDGPDRGKVTTFLTVPVGAETCGPVVDAVEGSVMVCVQHPGEVDGASIDNQVSRFPYDGMVRTPRPGVVQALKRR